MKHRILSIVLIAVLTFCTAVIPANAIETYKESYSIDFDGNEIFFTETPKTQSWQPENSEDQLGKKITYLGTDYTIGSWSFCRWKNECKKAGKDGTFGLFVGNITESYAVNGCYPLNDGKEFVFLEAAQKYKVELDIKVMQLKTANGVRLVLGPAYDSAKERWSNDSSCYQKNIIQLVKCKDNDYSYYTLETDGSYKGGTSMTKWHHISLVFETPSEFPTADSLHPFPNQLGLYAQVIGGDSFIIDNISVAKTDEEPTQFGDGNVKIYVGDELYTKFPLTAGEPFPEFQLPPAPEGKYFKGLTVNKNGTTLLNSNVLPDGVDTLYAVFADYDDDITESFNNASATVILPYNRLGNFYTTTGRFGWGFREIKAGKYAFFGAYDTWAVQGCYVAANDNGEAIVIRPYAKYRMTVKYRAPSVSNGGMRFKLAYGLEPSTEHKDITHFVYNDTEITLNNDVKEGEAVYEFETGSLKDVLPVAGLYFVGAPATASKRNEFYVDSIHIECLAHEKSSATLDFGDGFAETSYKNKTAKVEFYGEENTVFPVGYAKNRAFNKWYENKEFTVTAGEYLENGKTYYAGYVPYGDVTDDGNVDNTDLIRAKKYIAGQQVEITGGIDVTGDGSKDNTDLIRLKKYMAGQKVRLGREDCVALFFDGINENTEDIADMLESAGAHGSFTLAGVKMGPSQKSAVQKIIGSGSEIVNGTCSESDLTALTTIDSMVKEFTDFNAKFDEYISGAKSNFAALPEGKVNSTVLVASEIAKVPVINGIETDKNDIVNSVKNTAFDGAILKIDISVGADKIKEVISALGEDGFKCMTVSELFAHCGIEKAPCGVLLTEATENKAPEYKGDRKLVWSDEFDGDAYNTFKWGFNRTMNASDRLYKNDAEHVFVQDGILNLRATTSATKNVWALPEGMWTKGKMLFKYGYVEMCANIHYGDGAWPGFWMQSSTPFSKSPVMAEVDVFEVFGTEKSLETSIHKWYGDNHTQISGIQKKYKFATPNNLNNQYHIYGMEWDERYLKFYFDGQLYCTIDTTKDFDTTVIPGMECFHDYYYLIINNELFSKASSWKPNGVVTADSFPIEYNVDWVRLYQKDTEDIIIYS